MEGARRALGSVPAGKKLVVLDTCHAGALGTAVQSALLTRGLSTDAAAKVLSRAMGSTILSASTSVQEALEGHLGHGLFSWVLAEGLAGGADSNRDGIVTTAELSNYVDETVPALAQKLFKREQFPTVSLGGQVFPVGRVK